jgi:hypothetical protein
MKRTALSPGTKPLSPMSEKRRTALAAAGVVPSSTFFPKLRRTPLPITGTSVGGSVGGVVAGEGRLPRPRPGLFTPFLRKPAAVIRKRSGGWCELQLKGCWGRATDKSHRVARGNGGRRGEARIRSDRPSNALDSCRHCHGQIHAKPAWAKQFLHGWALEDWQEPLQYPVLYRGELSYLDDVGGVHSFEKAGA